MQAAEIKTVRSFVEQMTWFLLKGEQEIWRKLEVSQKEKKKWRHTFICHISGWKFQIKNELKIKK